MSRYITGPPISAKSWLRMTFSGPNFEFPCSSFFEIFELFATLFRIYLLVYLMHDYANKNARMYNMPTITIQQFEQVSLIVCCSFLILFMLFILYRLSKDSNAGKYGMFVIFFALSLGIFGFAMKSIIHIYLV